MAQCECPRISTADTLVFGAIQILIGTFHIFMWYFLRVLYMGQIKGVFGTYEPITYKTGSALWGIFFIISGVFLIKIARHPTPQLVTCALVLAISCIMITLVGIALTIFELSRFGSVSYRNYGQARLGREVSRILLFSYHLELVLVLTYSIFGCVDLNRGNEDDRATVREEAGRIS
ncbi:membrane-spanning 4-domains subfamily A member 13 [Pteronotus mesoamericanus]|uniref:membrane-spanning 4-domains subfamily A member 13 n=1 Tax=Pteronotus mesoamericanus TaxID=1884717 RepID=UPI0023EDBA52|nr:membrane-spanning 4-domains subfamily A member 13 [Pteronotus parnellii mesoamericanus]